MVFGSCTATSSPAYTIQRSTAYTNFPPKTLLSTENANSDAGPTGSIVRCIETIAYAIPFAAPRERSFGTAENMYIYIVPYQSKGHFSDRTQSEVLGESLNPMSAKAIDESCNTMSSTASGLRPRLECRNTRFSEGSIMYTGKKTENIDDENAPRAKVSD